MSEHTAESGMTGIPTFPCCEHCVPDESGKCWASEVGHGCSCLDCPPTSPDDDEEASA